MMLTRWLIAGCLLLCSSLSQAQQEFIPPMPEDFGSVEFSLITVGFGSDVHTAFGHTILRVIDRKAMTDMVVNWGVFDFNDPWFLFNFAYGRLNYRMAINSISTTLRIYRYEQRTVIQNKLYLTDAQKRRLMEKIIWQSHPENLYYPYHYYFDNCSTRVRDYIDIALEGEFLKKFGETKSLSNSQSLRESIQHHFRGFAFVSMALDLVMNSDLEDKMNAWQEMFMPASLQAYLKAMPQIDDTGQPVLGTTLLGEDQVLLEYQEPDPSSLNGYEILLLVFGLPLVLGGILRWLVPSYARSGLRLFSFGATGWGLVTGLFSLAMIWYWAVSVHTHGFHNANLWLLWPTDLLWAWYGLKWLKKGEPLEIDSPIKRLLYYSCWGHVVCIPLFLLLFVSGILKQDVSNSLLYLAPVMLFSSFVTLRWGLIKEPSSHDEASATA